jgi:hypothetical protein
MKKKFKKSKQDHQESLLKIDALDDLNKDLSLQLQHLLSKMDSSYCSSINKNNPLNPSYNSDNIITSHLVVYDDINQLQSRNIQLLTALRALSKDHEAEEALVNYKRGDDVSKNTANNDELMLENLNVVAQELEKLKDARLRAEELAEKFKQGKGSYLFI